MVKEFLQISFDPSNKVWKSINYPYKDNIKYSLGEKFLKTMRSIESTKIIDHFYDTNTVKTAKEVYEQAILVATNLQRLGVKKGDVVSLFSMNNEMSSVLTMGCILIGALVNFYDARLVVEYMDATLDILKPTVILYEEEFKIKMLKSLERRNQKCCKHLITIDGSTLPSVQNDLLQYNSTIDFDSFESVKIEDPQQEIACLLLTSGSTGTPKIAQITHSLMLSNLYVWWNNNLNYAPLDSDSVVLSFGPLRWITQVGVMLQSMLFGIKRVSSRAAPNGRFHLELLRHAGVTHLYAIPLVLYDVLLELDDNDMDSLKSVKMLQIGGESPSKAILDLMRKHAVNCKVFHCYGMTELSTITNDEKLNGGKLLPGFQIQILDENLRPLGPNQPGQLAIKAPFPLKGYRGLDNTGCKFLNDRHFFINGDYGFIDDNHNLHFMSRYKNLIRSNNYILSPCSLEYEIFSLPEVLVVRVVGFHISPDDSNGIGAVFVIINKKISSSHEELHSKIVSILKSRLSPAEFEIIQDIHIVDNMPLLTCGKIDRVALSKLALVKHYSR